MLRPLTLTICSALGLTACGGLEPCEESVLPTCDPREADCQRDLHAHVACVRDGDQASEPPAFEFVSKDEYMARYNSLPSPSEDAMECLGLTSLWPHEYVQTFEDIDATARFDVERRQVVVVDSAQAKDVQIPILRAIAQAQRDGELGGFVEWRAEHGLTSDQTDALDALFFGEGWFFGDAAALKTEAEADEDFHKRLAKELKDYEPAERELFQYTRSLRFDYRYVNLRLPVAGARFALKNFLADNPGATDEAFARPVASTAELIRRRLTDTPPAAPNTPYELPPGFGLRAPDRLGAAMYFNFLMHVDPIDADNVDFEERKRYFDVAGRWMGDRFDCARDGAGTPLVVWEFAFDPGVELELFEMTRNAPGEWQVLENEDSLILVSSYSDEIVAQVIASLEASFMM